MARGVGELDLDQAELPASLPVKDDVPYLLLDVREADDFDKCHIKGGKCWGSEPDKSSKQNTIFCSLFDWLSPVPEGTSMV